MRRFEPLWNRIKDADPEAWVYVNFKRIETMQTIINGIQLEKTTAQSAQKVKGLPLYGKLSIRREPEKMRVGFRLEGNGNV